MTVSTFYSSTADGYIDSFHATYATARAGAGFTVDTAGEFHSIGQYAPGFYVDEGFIEFDTSAIPDTDVISAVTLSLYGKTDNTITNYNIQCIPFDWGGTLTSADWQDGTEQAALTVLADLTTVGISVAGYNDLINTSSSVPMIAAISKTGTTRFVITSSLTRAGTQPTTAELFEYWGGREAQAGERRPRLVVTHAAGSTTVSPAAITQTAVITAPVVAPGSVAVSPAAITQTAAIHAPSLRTTLDLALIDRTASINAPTVTFPGSSTDSPADDIEHFLLFGFPL